MATESKYGEITASKKQFHPGEPVFLLRATDPFAPDAVREYATICEQNGCSIEHVTAVRMHADRISFWQNLNPSLVKNLPD